MRMAAFCRKILVPLNKRGERTGKWDNRVKCVTRCCETPPDNDLGH